LITSSPELGEPSIKYWDLKTGKEMFSLTGFQDQVFGFDHNYDGSLVAVVSKDKMLRIFDARSQKLIRVFFLKKQFFSNFIGYFFIKKKKKLL